MAPQPKTAAIIPPEPSIAELPFGISVYDDLDDEPLPDEDSGSLSAEDSAAWGDEPEQPGAFELMLDPSPAPATVAQIAAEATPVSARGGEGLLDLDRLQEITGGVLTPKGGVGGPHAVYGELGWGELVHRLYKDLFTGLLSITKGEEHKRIYYVNGFPVNVASNVRSEVLGYWLLSEGFINGQQHKQSIELMLSEGIHHGEAMVRLGILDHTTLFKLLRRQIYEKLLAVFRWESGEYELSLDADVARKVAVFENNPPVLILEGYKEAYPASLLLQEYDDRADSKLRATRAFDDYALLIHQYKDDLAVADLCDGVRRLSDVLAESPFGISATLRILKALEVMGCVAPVEARKRQRRKPARTVVRRHRQSSKPPEVRREDKQAAKVLQAYLQKADADFYGRLGLDQEASTDEVIAAWEVASGELHPDALAGLLDADARNKGKELYARLCEAYEVLVDPETRAAYDAELEAGDAPAIAEPAGDPGLAEATLMRGLAALEARDPASALRFFELADRQSRQAVHRMYAGWAAFLNAPSSDTTGREAAVDRIKAALREATEEDQGYVLLANTQRLMGKVNVARKLYSKALRLNPDNREATFELELLSLEDQVTLSA